MRHVSGILALLAVLIGAQTAQASEKLPVPWTFDSALYAQGADPGAPPPGANDFSCKPPKRHPNPVVLVHGLFASQTVNWQTVSPFLANRGYCVFSLTYGLVKGADLGVYRPGGLQPMERSARELKRFINRVLKRTGARKVDIVGHSEGSLMPNYYVKFLGGARRVDDYVGITTLWNGTNLAGAATVAELGSIFGDSDQAFYALLDQFCASCKQFVRGSDFLAKMHEGGLAARGVDYTNIVTRFDELVVPYTSGLMPAGKRVKNVVIQDVCPLDLAEHLAVAADPVTAGVVLQALDPRAPEPPCVPVLPFLGAAGYSGR